MRTNGDVGSVLFGRARRLVLGWLLGHPDESFFLRQIVRQTGLPLGSVQRELAALTSAGLVTRTAQGRQVYFQADRESPVFPELQSLFVKTAGVADVLRDALRQLAPKIKVACVFGSAARNELRNQSDVDLLVVGDVSFGDVVDAIADAQRVIGRDVNPSVYPADEFLDKIRGGHHFLNAVLREPYVLLTGDRDELEGLVRAQQVVDPTPAVKTGDRRSAGRRGPRPARKRR